MVGITLALGLSIAGEKAMDISKTSVGSFTERFGAREAEKLPFLGK